MRCTPYLFESVVITTVDIFGSVCLNLPILTGGTFVSFCLNLLILTGDTFVLQLVVPIFAVDIIKEESVDSFDIIGDFALASLSTPHLVGATTCRRCSVLWKFLPAFQLDFKIMPSPRDPILEILVV